MVLWVLVYDTATFREEKRKKKKEKKGRKDAARAQSMVWSKQESCGQAESAGKCAHTHSTASQHGISPCLPDLPLSSRTKSEIANEWPAVNLECDYVHL